MGVADKHGENVAHKPSDVPACDWHADIRMVNGNWLCIQFGTIGIDQNKANAIVEAIAKVV